MSLQALIEKIKSTREIWILKTPGGEFIYYEEPMNYDWELCSKKKFISNDNDEVFKLCEAAEVMRQAHQDILYKFKDWSKMQYCSEDAIKEADAIARGENG